MHCRAGEHSSSEREPGICLTWVSAACAAGLWSLFDAVLAVIATPIVRAKWQHLIENRISNRPVQALAGGEEDLCADINGHIKVVHYEDEDPALPQYAAHLLSDHKLDGRSAYGAA